MKKVLVGLFLSCAMMSASASELIHINDDVEVMVGDDSDGTAIMFNRTLKFPIIYHFDCRHRNRMKFIGVMGTEKNGEVGARMLNDSDTVWEKILPGSVGESMLKVACAR